MSEEEILKFMEEVIMRMEAQEKQIKLFEKLLLLEKQIDKENLDQENKTKTFIIK